MDGLFAPVRGAWVAMKKLSIVLPISRPNRVKETIDQIAQQVIPFGYEPNVIAVIDNTDVDLQKVNEELKKLNLRRRVFQFDRVPAGEFNSHIRRNRICEVMQKAAELVPPYSDGDMVFCLEDDTEIPTNTTNELLESYKNLTEFAKWNVGLVTALEAGRWGFKMIGAWRTDDVNDPTVMETIPYQTDKILEPIDGGGFYAFVTPANLFKTHTFTWHDECFGPDVMYGLTLRQKGYQNACNWSLPVIHNANGEKIRVDDKCIVLRYRKNDAGKWNLEGTPKR